MLEYEASYFGKLYKAYYETPVSVIKANLKIASNLKTPQDVFLVCLKQERTLVDSIYVSALEGYLSQDLLDTLIAKTLDPSLDATPYLSNLVYILNQISLEKYQVDTSVFKSLLSKINKRNKEVVSSFIAKHPHLFHINYVTYLRDTDMISKAAYDAVTDFYEPEQRKRLANEFYYEINKQLKLAKKGLTFIEVSHRSVPVMLDVFKELTANGYSVMMVEIEGSPLLRIYLKDSV